VSEYFNKDGIIFLDDDFNPSKLTESLYYSKIDVIKENFEKANQLPVAEDFIFMNYLQ
jgi:hypothetical protein